MLYPIKICVFLKINAFFKISIRLPFCNYSVHFYALDTPGKPVLASFTLRIDMSRASGRSIPAPENIRDKIIRGALASPTGRLVLLFIFFWGLSGEFNRLNIGFLWIRLWQM